VGTVARSYLIQSNGSVSRSQDTCVADQLRACSGGSAAPWLYCAASVSVVEYGLGGNGTAASTG
jgi:hypothetical protein